MIRSCSLYKAVFVLLLSHVILDAVTGDEVSRDDPTVAEMIEQAGAADDRGDHVEAIRLASLAIKQDPSSATAHYVRGRAHFRAGQITESLVDFDRYVELRPSVAPRQWERGIACYYAGKYLEGARQFELYQTFDGHDVENSVWRFLCRVPIDGVQKSQSSMLPIANDRRVPMMQVYELYRGKLTPEEVLAAARADGPEPEILAGRLFYAHLYLGLWYEVQGDAKQARHYVELAAAKPLRENRHINTYMWDVARIHAELLRGRVK